MHLDIEANILSIELSSGPISHAREFGQFIIHFSPAGQPVLLEILEADKFARKFEKLKNIKNIGSIAAEKVI